MKNLRRLALGLLVGVVAGLVVTVGSSEATIAEEVPLGSGGFSAADEGYVKIGKHYTKAHVDMNIGSVCGNKRYLPRKTGNIWPSTRQNFPIRTLSDQGILALPAEYQRISGTKFCGNCLQVWISQWACSA